MLSSSYAVYDIVTIPASSVRWSNRRHLLGGGFFFKGYFLVKFEIHSPLIKKGVILYVREVLNFPPGQLTFLG